MSCCAMKGSVSSYSIHTAGDQYQFFHMNVQVLTNSTILIQMNMCISCVNTYMYSQVYRDGNSGFSCFLLIGSLILSQNTERQCRLEQEKKIWECREFSLGSGFPGSARINNLAGSLLDLRVSKERDMQEPSKTSAWSMAAGDLPLYHSLHRATIQEMG